MPHALTPAIAWQAAGALFTALLSFALLVVLGRTLGTTAFGDYVSILSLAVVLLIPIEGGWSGRLYRDSVGAPEAGNRLLGSALAHVLGATTLLALAALLLASRGSAWFAALLCMGAVALMNLVSARLRAAGRFAREALWQAAGRLASALLILATVAWISPAPVAIFLAWMIGLLLVLAVGNRYWRRRIAWRGMMAALPATLPFLLIETLSALLMKGDVAVLRLAGAEGEPLSWYAACTRLNEAALLLFAPVGNVLLRSLRLQQDEPAAFARLWQGALLAALLFGGTAILGSLLLGDWLMATLFGADYAGAGALLPYTALVLPFALGNLALIPALLARGVERRLAALFVPAALLMVGGMALGHLHGGATLAAIALAVAQALLLGASLWMLRRASAQTEAHR